MSPEESRAEQRFVDDASWTPTPTVKSIAPAPGDLSRVFSSAGVDEDSARLFASAWEIARDVRSPIVIGGAGARYVSLAVARALSTQKVTIVDVGLGCVTPDAIRSALEDQNADVLLVRGIDHSDASLLAPDLLDLVVQRRAQPPGDADQKMILLCRSSGPAALALPPELEQLSIKLELSRTPDGSRGNPVLRELSPLQKKMLARVNAALDTRAVPDDLARAVPALI